MKNSAQAIKQNRSSRTPFICYHWRCGILLIPLAAGLAWLTVLPLARAVNPPPDGGYPNENTAEGTNSLLSLHNDAHGNTAVGFEALKANTFGEFNTAVGDLALQNNKGGEFNTAIGTGALRDNQNSHNNTAVGADALGLNTSGDANTATGGLALGSNTTGSHNTANGREALITNKSGNDNTATGFQAFFDGKGSFNTATGSKALFGAGGRLSTGNFNVADGYQALFSNSTGISNTANGYDALLSNTTGGFNVADGANALQKNTNGGANVATGGFALHQNITGDGNTAAGFDALFNTTGNKNIGIGIGAGQKLTTGDNNIDIGNEGVAAETNTIRIGTQGTQAGTFIAGISGVAVSGSQVMVNANGRLGVAASSARFKEAIKPMDKASEAILALKPVSFRYNKELDRDGTPQFGLIAEEVEKINPGLVARDEAGKPYTVRYEAVNAMLLNEFLKAHRKVQDLESDAREQTATIARQQKQIDSLTTGLQKVRDQLELNKRRPRVAANDQ